jgi:DNA polymerase III alpha subunit
MMDALRRMKPTCIEDIVALVALYRPGPMENIPPIARSRTACATWNRSTPPSTTSLPKPKASSSIRNR